MKITRVIYFSFIVFLTFFASSCGKKAVEDRNQILESENKSMKEQLAAILKQTEELKTAITNMQAESKQLGSNLIQQQELAKLKESQLDKKTKEELDLKDKEELDLKEKVQQLTTSIEDLKREKDKSQLQNNSLLINKIVVLLDRIKEEPRRSYSTWSYEDFSQEESRLKSLANSEKSEMKLLIAELQAAGFKESDNVESLVDQYVKDYGFWVSYENMLSRHFFTFGEWDQNLKAKSKEFDDSMKTEKGKISSLGK